MMMGGMMGAGFGWMFLIYSVLMLALVLAFAYIVWILSAKETGNIKLIGQVLSIVIAVLVILIFLYGAVNVGRMRGNYGYGGKMGGKQMKQVQEMQKLMKQMHKEVK
jgi:type VI protein secretion system component VasK